jgi:hypothetical protein
VAAAIILLVRNCACLSKIWMKRLNADSTLQIQSQWTEQHWYLQNVTEKCVMKKQ